MEAAIKKHLTQQDPILAHVMEQLEFPTISSTHTVFHDLMSCTIEQQIHYRSTKRMFARMLEKAGLSLLTPNNFEEFEERALHTVKLSGRKIETIGYVLDFFQAQQLDWQSMEDAEVRKTLSKIKGIGPWTVDMILLYTLERPDVFPVQDYHVKKLMASLYDLPEAWQKAKELKQIAAAWSPYRSYGVKYLFAWKASANNILS